MVEMNTAVLGMKYALMACNAFGMMLGLFVVLFGMAYPEENFPGGHTGKETAGISGFFMLFALIGYNGATRQKIFLLVPYAVIIFLFLGGNIIMWTFNPEGSVLDPQSKTVFVLGGLFIILMVFALILAWQETTKGGPEPQTETYVGQVEKQNIYPSASASYLAIPRNFLPQTQQQQQMQQQHLQQHQQLQQQQNIQQQNMQQQQQQQQNMQQQNLQQQQQQRCPVIMY